MDLKTYVQTLSADERAALAEDAGTTPDYLTQLIGGHRRCGPELAKALEKASRRKVTKAELRPDLWGRA